MTDNPNYSKLKKLIEEIDELKNTARGAPEFNVWKKNVERALKQIFPNDDSYPKQFLDISFSLAYWVATSDPKSLAEQAIEANERYVEGLNESKLVLESFLEETKNSPSTDTSPEPQKTGKNIFIVHGHDRESLLEIKDIITRLKLTPIILHEQEDEGFTIIEKLETHSVQADYAIILLTPDDVGYPKGKESQKKFRARQNVFLELGLFLGLIGRKKLAVIYKEDVEIPSDYKGVIFIPLEGEWRIKLAKEMKKAGINLSLDDL